MTLPLMPKATAIWLIDNTCLTFEQIADFCGLHVLEVESFADREEDCMTGFDPIASSQLTKEEIHRCEKDPSTRLRILPAVDINSLIPSKRTKYTPLAKRKDKPSAILWLTKYYPDLTDAQISQFLGTTKLTVRAIRNKTHQQSPGLEPHSPVALGFCSQAEFDRFLAS